MFVRRNVRRLVGIGIAAEVRQIHVGFHLHRRRFAFGVFVGHRVVVEHDVFRTRIGIRVRRFVDRLRILVVFVELRRIVVFGRQAQVRQNRPRQPAEPVLVEQALFERVDIPPGA